MIRVERLSDCVGSARFGDCIICSRNSANSNDLFRFTFFGETHNTGTSVVLCEKHIAELKHRTEKALSKLEGE